VRDEMLAALLSGDAEVSPAEAREIVAGWPAPGTRGAQIPLGAFALFHDLLRLVWLHEWAHALCGHAALVRDSLGLVRLHEFAADRAGNELVAGLGWPRHEVLQSIELHADEFATRYCVGQLLSGQDTVGELAGPSINLVERLVIFNLACCVFAVMWAEAEQRWQPGISFYPPRPSLDSDRPEPLYVSYPTSHPPAALRYMRFRDFQQEQVMQYALRNPKAATLGPAIDGHSFLMLEALAPLHPRFWRLRDDTPGPARTPEVGRLIAYETHLLKIGRALAPLLEKTGYVPTADPYAEPGA